MPTILDSTIANLDIQVDLKGHRALVTGGNRGIGKAIALTLAKSGASVAICGRDNNTLDNALFELQQYSSSCRAYSCDISQEEGFCRMIAQVKSHLGNIDILINNAGQFISQSVSGHSYELWQKVINTNLNASMIASREVLSEMLKNNWGRIINISSISGKSGEINGSAYSASKFGLIGLTQSLALETAKYGITVNAVCPGWVETEMANEQLNDRTWCQAVGVEPSDSVDIARLSVPQMRFIETSEVSQLVLYLCSNAAKGITGQAINICGGLSLH